MRASRVLCRRGGELRPCFADRQVDKRGEDAERDVCPPHPVVAAGRLERLTAEPGTEEAADLVRQDDEAEERREIARTVQLGDQTDRRRNGREISEADDGGEDEEHNRRLRRVEEDQNATARAKYTPANGHLNPPRRKSRPDQEPPAKVKKPENENEPAPTEAGNWHRAT